MSFDSGIPLSIVKTMESYEVSLATINQQTLYNSGILHQAYGIIGRLPMNLTRFADLVIIWVVHFLERMGLITASDQTMLAVVAGTEYV